VDLGSRYTHWYGSIFLDFLIKISTDWPSWHLLLLFFLIFFLNNLHLALNLLLRCLIHRILYAEVIDDLGLFDCKFLFEDFTLGDIEKFALKFEFFKVQNVKQLRVSDYQDARVVVLFLSLREICEETDTK
jgi:hypothetical protein